VLTGRVSPSTPAGNRTTNYDIMTKLKPTPESTPHVPEITPQQWDELNATVAIAQALRDLYPYLLPGARWEHVEVARTALSSIRPIAEGGAGGGGWRAIAAVQELIAALRAVGQEIVRLKLDIDPNVTEQARAALAKADGVNAGLTTCAACGETVSEVVGCPDVREVCRECFEEGGQS